jgi:ATP-dependent helicase/nuclease subunit A
MTMEQARAANPNTSVWVQASAGTGKTKVLTDRVLRLLLAGAAPTRLLALTFTKAAAAEMANRLLARLGKWTTLTDADLAHEMEVLTGTVPEEEDLHRARSLFAIVLDEPGGIKIQTIHSFCQSILGRFPIEAGISPQFELLDDRTAQDMMFTARERMLMLARDGADPALVDSLRTITAYGQEGNFADLMQELVRERGRLAALLDRHRGVDQVIDELRTVLDVAPGSTVENALAAACEPGVADEQGLRRVCEAMLQAGKTDKENGARIAAWLETDDRLSAFESYRQAFFTSTGGRRAKLCHGETEKACAFALDVLSAEAARLDALRDRLNAIRMFEANASLLRLGLTVLEEYRAAKHSRALIDFDDLILKTRELLSTRAATEWVLYKLDGGIDHVLLDEAQDTNPDQWEVVSSLVGDFFSGIGVADITRTVFAVGDTKQSIYSFQRADPAGFARMRDNFSRQSKDAGLSWDEVALDVSFRSVASVLEAVDVVFAQTQARSGVGLDEAEIAHRPHRTGHAGVVEVWPLPSAPEQVTFQSWEAPVEYTHSQSGDMRLAQVIAGQIKHWIASGEILESKGRPIRPGDVLVMVRRRTKFVEALVRSLKEAGIPVAGADRMVLTEQIAVMDMLALGKFLLLPEDDYNLACLLKSPLYNLGDDHLFALCHGRHGSLWKALRAKRQDDALFEAATAALEDLLAEADYVRPFELFSHVLGARGGRRKMLARLGPDASDPLDELLNMALAFEKTGVPTLQGFLHWVEAGDAEIKRDAEQSGRDEVRIMTVHGAKGLQAPIVFMPDTTQVPTHLPLVLWPAADGVPLWAPRREIEDPLYRAARVVATAARDQEYNRLLYVAMTRAEDRLYVCGWPVGSTPAPGSWYEMIWSGLASTAAPIEMDFTEVSPAGWRGQGLRLSNPQTAPVDTTVTSVAASTPVVLPDFLNRLPPTEPLPALPLVPSRPETDEPAARSPIAQGDQHRFLRGLLTHRLLQTLPDVSAGRQEEAARSYVSNPVHELDEKMQASIVSEVMAVLRHADFGRLFGPGSQAEVPVVGLIGDRAISGVIDRLLVTDEEVLIVDYKTNRPPPDQVDGVSEAYLHQLASYREVLRKIYPGRPIRCALIWTYNTRLMEIADALLDQCRPTVFN